MIEEKAAINLLVITGFTTQTRGLRMEQQLQLTSVAQHMQISMFSLSKNLRLMIIFKPLLKVKAM